MRCSPQHVFRVYGEERINTIARVGSTGVGRSPGGFGSCYLQPGEFERLESEGVKVVTMEDIEALERAERSGKPGVNAQLTLL